MRLRTTQWSALVVSLFLFFNIACIAQRRDRSSTLAPKWTAELRDYGWLPDRVISNRAFFKDFTFAKLEAVDPNTRIRFVSEDVVVVYHTNEQGQNWRTASRQLEAFFISAKDGRLLGKRVWPTSIRGAGSDYRDSESRLIPLSDGRFLVFANHTMLLYGSNLELLREKKLKPSTSDDLWSAQSVAGGHKIFLRHQSASVQQTTYFWLSPETLLPLAQMPGFKGKSFSVIANAGDNYVLTLTGFSGHGMTTGLAKIGIDGSTKIICSDKVCREGGATVISACCIAISARYGIGVVDAEKGLLWSQRISSTSSPNDFEFGDVETSMSGNRFAIWATAYHKAFFDGVKLSQSPTLLLYNTTSSHNLFSIPIDRQTGDFDFALSPDGSEIAIFDGVRIKLYAVDANPRMSF